MVRTTITLTPEAESLLHKVMRERGLSFKDAVNTAIIDGLTTEVANPGIDTPTRDIGLGRMPLDRALSVAGDLEDEELLRKREVGK